MTETNWPVLESLQLPYNSQSLWIARKTFDFGNINQGYLMKQVSSLICQNLGGAAAPNTSSADPEFNSFGSINEFICVQTKRPCPGYGAIKIFYPTTFKMFKWLYLSFLISLLVSKIQNFPLSLSSRCPDLYALGYAPLMLSSSEPVPYFN